MLMKSTLMTLIGSHTKRDKKVERGGAIEEQGGHQQEQGRERVEYDQNVVVQHMMS